MRTAWILATALALGISPALSQAREREHRANGRSGRTEQRARESRHDSHRGRASHAFFRAARHRGARGSIHIHRSAGYYPRYYFAYDANPNRASLRIQVNPSQAEVYVDGYYAGIVDDFDGVFQRLHVTPGGHEITLRLDGFRTWSAEIYAAPQSTVKLHQDLIPGPSDEAAEAVAEADTEADAAAEANAAPEAGGPDTADEYGN
jgi:hypothetical protein